MKATGIIRRIDDLGRVVIPKEIRRSLKIREGEALEIYTIDGGVVFKKYSLIAEQAITTAIAAVKALARQGVRSEVYNLDGEAIGKGANWDFLPEWQNYQMTRHGLQVLPIIADGELQGYVVYDPTKEKSASNLAKSMAHMIGYAME